ncbi:hypothetical protein [Massilia sp. CCM 8734]|nr:hypothetical protein [Massilia sp. CCM 8734]
MDLNARCTPAGPPGQPIPTPSLGAFLWARLHRRVMVRLRW